MEKYERLLRMKQLYFILYLFSFFNAFAQEKKVICGTTEELSPAIINQMSRLPGLLIDNRKRTNSGEMSICRVAVEIDSETYLRFEKDTSAIIRTVLENIEKCSEIYESEINTRLVVSSIRIWKDTEPDPYIVTNNTYQLFAILSIAPWPNQPFDKRMYLYTKQLDGPSGLASIDGPISVSPLHNIWTIMHEVGHNFGSPHTHNCAWPGGPIDYCVDPEGNCYNKALEPNKRGTIMSYCGSNNITFHPLSQAIMKSHAESNFGKILQTPPAVTLTGDFTVSRDDFFTWPAVIPAKKYQISYSVNPDFSGEIIMESPVNGFSTRKLMPGTNYYLRIKAVNSFGSSAWSAGARLIVVQKNLETPFILAPVGAAMLVEPGVPVELSFTPVDNVTGYEIQVAQTQDLRYDSPQTRLVTENHFSFTPYRSAFRWRVRAVRNNQKGSWSEEASLIVNTAWNGGLYIPLPYSLQDVPLSFPFNYQPIGEFSQVRIMVADNINFSNPIVVKNQEFVGVIKDLPANKNLYLRIQEWNTDRRFYPDVPLADYTLSFTTGNRSFPANLKFMAEIEPDIFGQTIQNLALGKNYIWCERPGLGFIRIDPLTLKYDMYNRSNTDGLIGYGMSTVSLHSDRNMKINFMGKSTYNSNRRVIPSNEDLTGNSDILSFSNPILDFNPDGNLYWNSHVLFREINLNIVPFKSFPDHQYILQVKVLQNKVWILFYDENLNTNEIVVADLSTGSTIENISSSTNTNVKKRISQIEVSTDGTLWLRQDDFASGTISIARYSGNTWSLFDADNSPFGSNIASMSLSPNGDAYIIITGDESHIYKFKNSNWEDIGVSIPLQYFSGDLVIDKNENIWFSTFYGLARLTSGTPLPVTLISFEAAAEINSVTLSWKVTDEIDMDKYVVEHSRNGKNFSPIGEIATTNSTLYNLVHRNPINGNNYYRLKSIETDGDFAYSKVISVYFSNGSDLVFFPNPTTGQLNLKIKPDMINQSGLISIIAADGREISKKEIGKLKETEPLDLSKLAGGIYMIRIENKNETIIRSVEVVR